MCGITGVLRFDNTPINEQQLRTSVSCLNKRGPDAEGIYIDKQVGLGHTRLAIIDLDPQSNQPFHDVSGRYTLIFNGEIFNYIQFKKELTSIGIQFHTNSDTEVLLQLLIHKGKDCLTDLNGFFAFAFYDNVLKTLLIGRDKYGVKPLYIYRCKEYVAFSSELKSLVKLGIPKKINFTSLFIYLQLNYVPSPDSILEGVQKLKQGHVTEFDITGKEDITCYYHIITNEEKEILPDKNKLESILDSAVKDRLVSDVPVGVFLSGGVDSSIVTLLAKRHKSDIQSFSIGFKENKAFDESKYAEKVAGFIGTNHHTFHLSNEIMISRMEEMLDYIDEPFADSSAIAVFNLCFETRKKVTVALTGDGADEVFGGYNKHRAEYNIRKSHLMNSAASLFNPLLKYLPEGRGAGWSNYFRKLKKYSSSLNMIEEDRYWDWCSFYSEGEAKELLSAESKNLINEKLYQETKSIKTEGLSGKNLNSLLLRDVDMVLEGDMLVKTDRMSMANSMELRNPFLDSRLVDYAFSLNASEKINGKTGKKILKDTFRPYLPAEVFDRPKRGFEVPLTDWLKTDLQYLIEKYLNPDFLSAQNIFSTSQVLELKARLHSKNPGKSAYVLWTLINFQVWYKKYIE